MEIKLFEIRDRATMVPVIAIRMVSTDEAESWLLQHVGFSRMVPCIQLIYITANKTEYDPYNWADRTMQTAHIHIESNFDTLESGDVIDVEYILGEKEKPKISERLERFEP